MAEQWETRITSIEPNKILLRGYRLDELMGKTSFAAAVYLALKGELPGPKVERMLDAILVSSIDHGVTPPSALAALNVASTGAGLTASLASGILAISRLHGGAVEDCMKMLVKAVSLADLTVREAAELLVGEYVDSGRRLPGLGHRIHNKDPRTIRLLALAHDLGLEGDHLRMAIAIQDALPRKTGKTLPINVDGAIAAVLCDLGFTPEFGNCFFIIARVPGLISHIIEEMALQKAMRVVTPGQAVYTGTPERSL